MWLLLYWKYFLVNVRGDVKNPSLSPQTFHRRLENPLKESVTQLVTFVDWLDPLPIHCIVIDTSNRWYKQPFVTYCIHFTNRLPMFPSMFCFVTLLLKSSLQQQKKKMDLIDKAVSLIFISVPFQWPYEEFISIAPNTKQPQTNEFLITMRKGKKTDTMRFSTDHRADLLTEALRFRNKFAEKNISAKVRVWVINSS